MRILIDVLVFLFFVGMIGTVLVLVLTFLDDLREIFDSESESAASTEASGRPPEPVEVA